MTVTDSVLISEARRLAAEARTVLTPQLLPIVDGGDHDTPLSLTQLKEIARSRNVVAVEFGAPLGSEGRLVRLASGGFKVLILRPETTSRARFSLAHEIGHTFINETVTDRLRSAAGSSDIPAEHADESLTEIFCDVFAAELLFPQRAAELALRGSDELEGPVELLSFLERTARRWCVSVEVVLARMNSTGGFGEDIVVVVLRHRPHRRSRQDPTMRVARSFPRPALKWFIPTNQRAESTGLKGALALHDSWKTLGHRRGTPPSRRSGVWSIEYQQNGPCVLENAVEARECREAVKLWMKRRPDTPWIRVSVDARVAYRLYAMNAAEAYAIAVVALPFRYLPVKAPGQSPRADAVLTVLPGTRGISGDDARR